MGSSGARKDGKDAVAKTFWRMVEGKMTFFPFHGSAATVGKIDALLLKLRIDARRRPTDQCTSVKKAKCSAGQRPYGISVRQWEKCSF